MTDQAVNQSSQSSKPKKQPQISFVKEFKTLKPYFLRHRKDYVGGLLCLIAVDAAQIMIPQWTRRAVNIVQSGNFLLSDVLRFCAAMVLTMLFVCAGRFLWRYFLHGASRRIEAELRETLFDHLVTLNGDFYEKNKTGDLMARMTNDVGAVRMAVGWGLVAGIDGTIMAAGILFVIFFQAPLIAFCAMLPIPLIMLLILLFGRAVGGRFKRAQEAYSSMSESVQESFAGIRVIKSFVREEHFIGKFALTNDEYVKANMSVVRIFGFFLPLILFLSGLITLIVLFAGGRSVALGRMNAGDLVSLIAYIQMLVWPMFGAGFTVNMIQRGAVSMARINEILETKPRIRENPDALRIPQDAAAPLIRISNLTFSYHESKPVLRDISLDIKEGEWLGIFGRTGSGKSTLVKLFPRLLDAPAGSLFIKGKDVRDWSLTELRALFGIAPQDSFLFSDSLENNVMYGLSKNGIEENGEIEGKENVCLSGAVQLAALEKDLASFNSGLATPVGERGMTLSGGQKQRVTIARAAILESPVLLLDDSLSACDAETEKNIIINLEKARRGKTTIIISHRVSAFRFAGHVAVLEDGSLAEYGSPAQLLAQNGLYAKTARLQQLATQTVG